MYQPPLGRFSMIDMFTVGLVPVRRRSVFEMSSHAFFEDLSFVIGTLLVVRQSSLENRLRGG